MAGQRSRGKRAGIPAPVGVKDPAVEQILWAMREHMLANQGYGNAARSSAAGAGSSGSVPDGETPVRPLAPEALVATGIFGAIILEIARIPPGAAYVEWIAADVDDIGQAVVVGTSAVPIWIHFVGDRVGRYYWCRGVSYGAAALRGPLNDAAGTYAISARDPEYVKDQIEQSITESELYADLLARIELIDGPPDLIGSVNDRLATLGDAFDLRADAIETELTTGLETAANERAAEAQARESAVSQAYGDLRLYADSGSAAAVKVDQIIAAFGGNIATALSYIVSEVDDDLAITTAFDSFTAQFGTQQDAINARATIETVNQVASDAAAARIILRQDIDAEFVAVNDDLGSRATITDLADAVAAQNEARAQLGASVDARFENLEQGAGSYATVDQLVQAQADDESARGLLASNIAADFQSQQDQIDAKASVTALNEAVSNAASARATLAQQYDTQFQSIDDDLATRATLARVAEVESDAASARAALGDQFTVSLEGLEDDIESRVTVTELTDAIATETGNRVAQYNGIQAQYTNLADDVSVQGGAIDNLVLDFDTIDGEVSAAITRVEQVELTVDGYTSAIQQITEVNDDLSVQYTLKASTPNPNNPGFVKVSGVGLASGPVGEAGVLSELYIAADRIGFIDPADDIGDTATFPFVYENGIAAFDTTLIKEATITSAQIFSLAANKIVADELSAISANLGEVDAGTFRTSAGSAQRVEVSSLGAFPIWVGTGAKTANNADLYLDAAGLHAKGDITARRLEADAANIISTLMLQDQAVTFPLGVYSASPQNISNNSFTQAAYLYVPSGRFLQTVTSVVLLAFSYEFAATVTQVNSSGNMTINVQIEVDGSVQRTIFVATDSMSVGNTAGTAGPDTGRISGAFCHPVFVTMGTGSHTLRMNVQLATGGTAAANTREITHKTMTLIGLKK